MKYKNKFDRYIAVTFFVTIITVILASYLTFTDIINSHNKKQHSAIVPLFSLVNSEIIRPLNMANFMANNQFLIDIAKKDDASKQPIISYLNNIAKQYNIITFIALEKKRLIIYSTGKENSLDGANADWFHRLKALPGEQFTDLGQALDPHLYFDNRIKSEDGEFLGFTGVAIDLDYFASKFKGYHERFGFQLYFVDHDNVITLSSDRILRKENNDQDEHIDKLSKLPWYSSLTDNNKTDLSLSSEVIYTTKDGLLISQMPIQALNWRMFIVFPPAEDQNEYWQVFLGRFIFFFIFALVFYAALLRVINYFKSRLVEDSEIDFLTNLPNRSHINRSFNKIVRTNETLSVALADIDNFKSINDTYGHLVGDDVLSIIAAELSQTLRKIDTAGRWGGEEFIMLFPDTDKENAQMVVERIRKKISKISFPISSNNDSITITVSFGICELPIKNNLLKDYVAGADIALYQAKHNGKNQSVIYNEPSEK